MSPPRLLPDPNQRRAADPRQSVFVTANAGSGKTSTLVDRVARLLLEDVKPGEILCVTYTKAAAAEMQSRLFERLGAWAVMDDEKLSESLADLDGRAPMSLSDDDLSKARRLFARALETPGGLKIQTIHAFCEKLLRRFPIEAGVSPRFKVLEDQAAIALSHEAREDLARAALKDPDGPVGQAYSHFAVELDWASFQALLGMIEGQRDKLTDYLARIADGRAPSPHIVVGADPDETPAAIEADFIRYLDRATWLDVADQMAGGSKNDQACAERMRQAEWSFPAVVAVFLTTTGEPRATMATKQAPPLAKAWLDDLQLTVLAALDTLKAARVAEDTRHVLTLAQVHAGYYEAAKARTGALDFADLVSRTAELLTHRANAAWVLYKLDGGIEHILVDEAQDTAPHQWDIVRAIADSFFAGAGARADSASKLDRTVFAVGDEKQSIYSFQGARPERLAEEAQTYYQLVTASGHRFEPAELATSFRSTPEVLAFVDAAFEREDRAIALTGPKVAGYPAHRAQRQDHGAVDLWPLYHDPEKVELDSWDPVDAEPEESGRKRMARDIAQDIRRQVETGVAVQDKKTRRLRPSTYGDFLILVRRRDATFEEIIRALKTAGVPVAGADRLKLSSHIVFDDLIAVARFALFPDDDLSLAEVLRSPLCDVPDFGPADSLYELAGADPNRGKLWRELQRRAREHPSWIRARALMDLVLAGRDRDPFSFFSILLNHVDDTGRSGRARILDRLGREAEEAIDETLNQVLAAEARGALDLERCVAELEHADVEVKRELEGPRGEVRVMTVHGAKGLEAPVVILPDTTAQAKPQGPTLMPLEQADGSEVWLMCPGSEKGDCPASADARAARKARAEAETLRLLYVALTRARDRIIVTGRAVGNKAGGFDPGSWFDVIQETFDRLKTHDIGDDRLRYGHDPGELPPESAGTTEAVRTPDYAFTPPPADAAARFASPSKMQAVTPELSPSPLAKASDGLGRYRRGDLIHHLLERLPDIPVAERASAAQRIMSRERDLSDDQRDEMIRAAFLVLDDARFAPVFGPGSRAEVALTGGAKELPRGVAVSGRIDRLVITPERVLVVDYKTNRPAPDRIEDADPAYVLQMAVYVAVLKRLYPDRPVEAALVWTDGPRLMAVPEAMMQVALAAAR